MELQCLVADGEGDIGGEALGHRAVRRRLGIGGIEARRGAPHHEPGRVELGGHVGNPNCSAWNSASFLPNCALAEISTRRLERSARAAERAGGDIEPAAIEPHHRDLESVALVTQAVRHRYAAILEHDHRCGLAIPTELLFLFAEGEVGRDTPRSFTTTAAPALAKPRAIARPTPRALPVTSATFPSIMPKIAILSRFFSVSSFWASRAPSRR
jgi:hypothetical protein